MEEFRQKRLISKKISFHALIKKNNYKSFRHVMQKVRITKKDGGVKVAEVNRNILGASNSYSLKTRKPVDFKKAVSYSLSSVPKHLQPRWKLPACSEKQTKRYFTARPKRSYPRRTTVTSRICNCCRYDCINKYHP